MLSRLTLFSFFGLLALPFGAAAYVANDTVPSEPYEVIQIEEVGVENLLIGTLNQFPVMYEIESDSEFTLNLDLRAVPTTTLPLLGTIVVRVLEPRGVEEVKRLEPSAATWEIKRDKTSGLPYAAGPTYEEKLPAGIYQIEVHTPDNVGQYVLLLKGGEMAVPYSEALASVSKLYKFYDTNRLGMIRSPLIYYPLLIIFVLAAFGYTIYRTRKSLPFFST